MTNEEAIKVLQYACKQSKGERYPKEKEAWIMAIQALEQQPCEDCISREAVKDMLNEEWTKYMPMELDINLSFVLEKISELPSVTPTRPKGKWIEKAEDYYKAINEYGGGVNEETPYFVDDIACPKCLKLFSVIDNETERFDFCPNCGAEMGAEE